MSAFDMSKAALALVSNQTGHVYEKVKKSQHYAFKLRLNATFNAPNIIIPINAHSDEALLLDLGKLIVKTKFFDNPLFEQQQINIENFLASRVKLDDSNKIIHQLNLLECPGLSFNINRPLHSEIINTDPRLSIAMQWDLIHVNKFQIKM